MTSSSPRSEGTSLQQIDAIVFDIGGTLVHEASAGTATDQVEVRTRGDVVAVLGALRRGGMRLGALTDTSVWHEADVRALLGPCGLDELLEVLVTSMDVGAAKPDPVGLRLVLDRLGVADPARALVIGDRACDADVAEAVGCPFVMVDPDAPLVETVRQGLRIAGVAAFDAAALLVLAPDVDAMVAADARQLRLTKPAGALGRLEGLGRQLAGIARSVPPPVPEPVAVAVFAGDHGVLKQGVSPWPQEVTAQMVANFAVGGAAVNVLAASIGASVTVVDVGVATELPPPALSSPAVKHLRVRPGTADLSTEAAMTGDEARQALDVGATVAADLVAGGARCLVTGDMGIGNTTPSAALIAALAGVPAARVTGRGSGIDDATLAHKVGVVAGAIGRLAADADPVDVLAEVGGLEHAALAGFIVGGAAAGVPVVVDGVIALSALLVAHALVPEVLPYVVPGHRSVEPGATVVLERLALDPLLDLGLRLGEGTGAVLAVPMLQAAARILGEMATFDEAGVG
jgi:nicotinate-nucleotide--dimethylbenzimidazole phosphoribosyltransferase